MVEVVFRDRQVVPVEQQKSEGKDPPHASRPAPQVSSALLRMGMKSSEAQNEASCWSSSGMRRTRADASSMTQKRAANFQKLRNMMETLALKTRVSPKRDKEREDRKQSRSTAAMQEEKTKEM